MSLQDFSGDFSDLDGTVRQRRQDMEESSSSGSQTPDYEKMAGRFPTSSPSISLNAMSSAFSSAVGRSHVMVL